MEHMEKVVSIAGDRYLRFMSSRTCPAREELKALQEKNWRKLRSRLRGTQISEDLNLYSVRGYEDFLARVPVRDYDFYDRYVSQIEAGAREVLFRDECSNFGLSSGTSGKDSKRIPLNESTIRVFLRSQKALASRITLLEGDKNLVQLDRLTFGSDPSVHRSGDFNYGYISGILSTRVPTLFRKKTFPSRNVIEIAQWDTKIDALIAETLDRDIQIISGIPTYMISVFEALLAHTGKREIREIWPNLKIFIYAATPMNQYADRINALVGHELNYYGYYAATEAPIGLPYQAYSQGHQKYLLNPELVYSFTPADSERCVGIHEVECGVPYSLNIGTSNGLVHYAMKDLIEFEELDGSLVFEFVGRKNTGINLAAEKVTDSELLASIIDAKTELNTDIRHFFVSPSLSEAGKPAYYWTLFLNETAIAHDPRAFASALDRALARHNGDYHDCRAISVIDQPQVRLLSAAHLAQYFERNRQKGQFKMKTTFRSSAEYQQFLRQNLPSVVVH